MRCTVVRNVAKKKDNIWIASHGIIAVELNNGSISRRHGGEKRAFPATNQRWQQQHRRSQATIAHLCKTLNISRYRASRLKRSHFLACFASLRFAAPPASKRFQRMLRKSARMVCMRFAYHGLALRAA